MKRSRDTPEKVSRHWQRFLDFVKLSRPHFLVGGVLTFALGAATSPSIQVGRYLVAQLMVSSAQLTAHFLNEFADRFVDAGITNRTAFSGGSGVLGTGRIKARVALLAGQFTSLVAVTCAVVVWRFSPLAALLGLGALVVSWAYSMPPVRLLGTGWGELATTAVVVGVVPLIGASSQGSVFSPALYLSIAILTPIHFAMMLAFEIPDIASDGAAGKRVVAVRLGRARTEVIIVAALTLAGFGLLIGVLAGAIGREATWAFGAIVPAWVAIVSVRENRFGFGTLGAVATLGVVIAGLTAGVRY